METKICSKCNEEFVINNINFTLRNSSTNRFSSRCKVCDKEYRQDNKERIAKQKKAYNKEHAEQNSKQNKIYKENNKEKVSVLKKKYYIENRAEITKKLRDYYKENIKMYSEKSKIYKQTKRGKMLGQLTSLRYISKKKQNISNLTSDEWEECLIYFNNRDAYTGMELKTISQDHIIPQSKNGPYSQWNIIPCNKNINSSKCNKNMEKWYRKQIFFDEDRLMKINIWINKYKIEVI